MTTDISFQEDHARFIKLLTQINRHSLADTNVINTHYLPLRPRR